MTSQRFPWPAIATVFVLALILAAAARLWWPTEFLLVIPSDDTQLMTVDREVLAGDWKKLWAPQDVHVFPLFRLIRLYFELHFAGRFRWLQLVVILAHWISVLLLFGLTKQYLRTSGGALVVAGLFAWNALGRVAFFRKADSSYILSLPLILGALYC